jgi:hypothetical protein
MGQADGELRQPLPEVTLICRSCLPRGFKDLVCVEGPALVKQPLSLAQALVGWQHEIIGNADDACVSTGKRPAQCVAGPGVAGPTTLVTFSVRSHGVISTCQGDISSPWLVVTDSRDSSSARKPSSSRTRSPSSIALTSLEPAFSPTTT